MTNKWLNDNVAVKAKVLNAKECDYFNCIAVRKTIPKKENGKNDNLQLEDKFETVKFNDYGDIINVEELFEGITFMKVWGKEIRHINVYLSRKNGFIMGNKVYWGPVLLYHTKTHVMSAIISELKFIPSLASFQVEIGRRQFVNSEITNEYI